MCYDHTSCEAGLYKAKSLWLKGGILMNIFEVVKKIVPVHSIEDESELDGEEDDDEDFEEMETEASEV